mgnify:CR=1 FL=1
MSKRHVLYPDQIGVVPEASIQDDTVSTISGIFTNFKDFQLGREAITLNKGFEHFEPEIFTPGGFAKVDSYITLRTAQVGITLGAWYHEMNALLQGMDPAGVKTDYSGAIDTAADATALTGAVKGEAVTQELMTVMVRIPLPRTSGDHLYIYLPKAFVQTDAADVNLTVDNQQKPVVTFEGLALESGQETKHQVLFSGVDNSNVIYMFSGQKD